MTSNLSDLGWLASQERKLGEEERRDLEKQAAAVEEQIAAGTADAEALRRAAAAYNALGQDDRAAGVLQQLTDKQPSDPAAWQLLVRLPALSLLAWSQTRSPTCDR
jgi:predicted Zn-dependent protease